MKSHGEPYYPQTVCQEHGTTGVKPAHGMRLVLGCGCHLIQQPTGNFLRFTYRKIPQKAIKRLRQQDLDFDKDFPLQVKEDGLSILIARINRSTQWSLKIDDGVIYFRANPDGEKVISQFKERQEILDRLEEAEF